MNQQLEDHDLVAHRLQSEEQNRTNEKTTYYLKLAKFRLPAIIEAIECSPAGNLTNNSSPYWPKAVTWDREKIYLLLVLSDAEKSPGLFAGL